MNGMCSILQVEVYLDVVFWILVVLETDAEFFVNAERSSFWIAVSRSWWTGVVR